jgi:predicted permease
MEGLKPLSPVIQVFLLIAAGFVFAHWKKISLSSVTEIIVYLGTPSLVFTSLASKPLYAGDIAVLLSGILLIFAGVGLLIRLYFLVFHFTSGGFALPSLFMNAGNMGIPLALFAFGQAGMQRFLRTEKYRQDPGLAASIVVIGPFISVLTIHIVFWLIL